MSTPYMGLILPVLNTTPDPTWSQDFLTDFTTIDSHNHTSGSGQTIPTAGIAVNADFPFNGYNLTGIRTVRFNNQVANPSLGTDLGCLYEYAGDFWYNNAAGQQVQITSGGGVNVSGTGGFKGDYVTSSATAYFNNTSNTFYYTNSSGTYSTMQGGALELTNGAGFSLTLQQNASQGSNYTVTFPASLPSTQSLLAWSTASSGAISSITPDGSTIAISGSTLHVPSGGITATQIASGTITTTQISSTANIATTQLAQPVMASGVQSAPAVYISVSSVFTGTNLSFTMTNTGLRDIVLELSSDGGFTTGNSYIAMYNADAFGTGMQVIVGIELNGTLIMFWQLGSNTVGYNNAIDTATLFPVSFVSTYGAPPPAGVNEYTVVARISYSGDASPVCVFEGMRLTVREI